jgi:hypothetical protein
VPVRTFGELFHQPTDKFRVETGEHPIGSLQYRHPRTGTSHDLREFGGDVAPAHHDHARGEFR